MLASAHAEVVEIITEAIKSVTKRFITKIFNVNYTTKELFIIVSTAKVHQEKDIDEDLSLKSVNQKLNSVK